MLEETEHNEASYDIFQLLEDQGGRGSSITTRFLSENKEWEKQKIDENIFHIDVDFLAQNLLHLSVPERLKIDPNLFVKKKLFLFFFKLFLFFLFFIFLFFLFLNYFYFFYFLFF